MALFKKDNKSGGDKVVPSKTPETKELGVAIKYESEESITDMTDEVAGLPWTITYYNQIVDKNSVVGDLDINKPIATQSYREVADVVMKLDSSIDSVNSSEITGSGFIDIEDVVNVGDVIVARLHNDRLAMLNVSEVKPRSYELNTIYHISFKLLTFVDNDDLPLYVNLLDKIATESVFVDESLAEHTTKKVMDKNTYMLIKGGLSTIDTIMTMYINKFYSVTDRYFTLKVNDDMLIDPYLNDFILKFFTPDDYRVLDGIERYGAGIDRERYLTIFDSLLGMADINYISKLGFSLKKRGFHNFHNYNSFKYEVSIDGDESITDKNYFVPKEIYNGEVTDSFDKLLQSYIKEQTVNIVTLNTELKRITEYTDMEAYFRVPILLVIFKLYIVTPNRVV